MISRLLGISSVALIAVSLVGTACRPEAEGRATAVSARDSAGVTVKTIRALPERLPEWKLGEAIVRIPGTPAAGSGAPQLENVSDALWLSDGRILVVDVGADRLHLYGPSGTYMESYGTPGQGPGEFGWIRNVSLSPDDSIFAWDASLVALKVFHPAVGFVRSTRLPIPRPGAGAAEVWRLGSGRWVHAVSVTDDPNFDLSEAAAAISPGAVGRLTETVLLSLLDDEQVLAGPVEVKGLESAIVRDIGNVMQPFSPRPFVHVSEDRVFFGTGAAFRVHELGPDLSEMARVEWPLVGEPLRRNEVDRKREEMLRRGISRRFVDAMFAEELLPVDRPAIQRLLRDSGGRLWVGRFEPPVPRPHETLWYVLNAEGSPIARVPLHGDSALLTAVRQAHVLIVTRDEMDVPQVEVRVVEVP